MPSLNLRNPLRRDPNRPTLKQRAAALKATAARVIRREKSDPTAEALARMGPHWPGFLPYPTHAPKALMAVESVLQREAERLLSIAHDEFARLYAAQSQGMDEPGQEMVAARLRRTLRIDALTMAADPRGDAHAGAPHADLTLMTGGVVDDDGRVTFCDAAGRVLRKPVADWIGFTAMRLQHQAHVEYARQISGRNLDEDEMQALARRLRRDLRTDALNILAFRSATAFQLAEQAEADAFSGPIPAPSIAGAGTVSPDLLRATEEHRDAQQLMLNDPAEDDERTDWHVERIGRLAQVLRDIPARSLADLRHKVLYLWPGDLEGAKLSDALAATFDSFREDLRRLAWEEARAPAEPDPILAAIKASRAAQAAVEAWSSVADASMRPLSEADYEEEDRVTKAQSEALSRVIDTVPTTPAGRLALLEFLRRQMGLYGYTDGSPPDQHSYFWRFAYKALKAALAWEGPAAAEDASAAGQDAELRALAVRWEAARKLYDRRTEEQISVSTAVGNGPRPGPAPAGAGPDFADWMRRVNEFRERTGIADAEAASDEALADLAEIEDQIAALPAHTLAGLKIKARVGQRSDSISVDWPEGLGAGLARDILAFAGPKPPPLRSRDKRPASLSDCSVRDLARLYDTIAARWLISSQSMGAPFCEEGTGYSAAGLILDAECDRLVDMMADIAREMKDRRAADDAEQNDRLGVLVRYEFECNGRLHDAALLADVNAAWGA